MAVGKCDIHCPSVLQTKFMKYVNDVKVFIQSSFRNIKIRTTT